MHSEDDSVSIRMHDYYSLGDARAFVIDSLPDADTEGSLFQSNNGVSPTDAITAVGTRIAHRTGAFVFVPHSSLLNGEVDIVVSVYSNSGATQLLSVDTVRVLVSTACPSLVHLHSPVWGVNEVQPPPPEQVTVWFDNALRKFRLSATLPYLHDSLTFVVDLTEFDQQTDDVRATTNCGARAPLPPRTPFAELWNAAPHSQFPSALGTADFLAYPPVQAGWTVSAGASCSNWTLERAWSFTELLGCQQRDGVTPSVAVLTDSQLGLVSYAGAVHIDLVRPLDAHDETAGLRRTHFVYPFRLRFESRLQATAAALSDTDFQISSRQVLLKNGTGCLHMLVQTVYVPGGIDGLIHQAIDLPPSGNGIPLQITAASGQKCEARSSAPCVQLWLVDSCPMAWSDQYNGDYTMRWEAPGASAPNVFGIVTIVQEAAPEGVEQSLVFHNGLRFFRTERDWIHGENAVIAGVSPPFTTGEIVYVRDDVAVAAGDEENFLLRIINAWICFTDNDNYIIEVADGKRGCLDPFILASQRVQLVADGVELAFGSAAAFDTLIDDGTVAFVEEGVVSTGMLFNAQPMAAGGSRNYTVHVQLELTQALADTTASSSSSSSPPSGSSATSSSSLAPTTSSGYVVGASSSSSSSSSLSLPPRNVSCAICVHTQGYWTTHGDPDRSTKYDPTFERLNGSSLCAEFLSPYRSILDNQDCPSYGNAHWCNVARQYAAMRLNLLRGDCTLQSLGMMSSELLSQAQTADQLLCTTSDRFAFEPRSDLVEALTMWNEGRYPNGPCHCGDPGCPVMPPSAENNNNNNNQRKRVSRIIDSVHSSAVLNRRAAPVRIAVRNNAQPFALLTRNVTTSSSSGGSTTGAAPGDLNGFDQDASGLDAADFEASAAVRLGGSSPLLLLLLLPLVCFLLMGLYAA